MYHRIYMEYYDSTVVPKYGSIFFMYWLKSLVQNMTKSRVGLPFYFNVHYTNAVVFFEILGISYKYHGKHSVRAETM